MQRVILCLLASTVIVNGRRIATQAKNKVKQLNDVEQPEPPTTEAPSPAMNHHEGWCPRWAPEVGEKGGNTPSFVYVTIKSASNIPWSLWDAADAYTQFWMGDHKGETWSGYGEKYWLAETPHLPGQQHPAWDWSCILFYEKKKDAKTSTTFNAKIWDRDYGYDDVIGTASIDLPDVIVASDELGHGVAEVTIGVKDKNGEQLKDGENPTTLQVRFEILHEPALYNLDLLPKETIESNRHKSIW